MRTRWLRAAGRRRSEPRRDGRRPPRASPRSLRTAARTLWRSLRQWSGDAAYETYLARAGEGAHLDAKAFYLDSLRPPLPRPAGPLLLSGVVQGSVTRLTPLCVAVAAEVQAAHALAASADDQREAIGRSTVLEAFG